MRDNLCIFSRIHHKRSGEDLELAYLKEGTYVESTQLDGPKLVLCFADPENYIKAHVQIREYDEFLVSFGDSYRENGVSEQDSFTVLTCTPQQDGTVKINLMASIVYSMKKIADKTRVFAQRGIPEILQAFSGGARLDVGKFPVVENYHNIAGERPSALLRQIAAEHGAHIWYARGTLSMHRFEELFAREPVMTFHWGTIKDENGIVRYTRPSAQLKAQEEAVRTFTGWNEVTGRVKTSPDSPMLSRASSKPATITGSSNTFVLGNGPVATRTAIDFVALGNMSVTAGQSIKIMWHMPDPANPINEGLPDRVVVEGVAHWYSGQRYYCRVKGAVALEPF